LTATIRYLASRNADRTIAYQRYYLLGLDGVARLRWSGAPVLARLAPGADAKVRVAYNLNRLPGRRRVEGHVGRYVAELDDRVVRFAIDAHDARDVRDEEALAWSDLYFKANRWPDDARSPKVAPVVNGNGLLDRRRIELLRTLRGEPRDVDVAFITYFRPAQEHLTRIFETMSGLQLRADLVAVFAGTDAPAAERYAERLGRAGVTVTTHPLTPEELWARLARAKVVLLRPGRHGCLPWRTLDLLALGSCIALVSPPGPAWPVPLRDGVEYAGCGLAPPADGAVASPAGYDQLAETVRRLVEGADEAASLRTAAASYFDEHAAPERVGRYLIERLGAGTGAL
jgi:glycosyltransferase involved in cell wall biosynthesis